MEEKPHSKSPSRSVAHGGVASTYGTRSSPTNEATSQAASQFQASGDTCASVAAAGWCTGATCCLHHAHKDKPQRFAARRPHRTRPSRDTRACLVRGAPAVTATDMTCHGTTSCGRATAAANVSKAIPTGNPQPPEHRLGSPGNPHGTRLGPRTDAPHWPRNRCESAPDTPHPPVPLTSQFAREWVKPPLPQCSRGQVQAHPPFPVRHGVTPSRDTHQWYIIHHHQLCQSNRNCTRHPKSARCWDRYYLTS